ncbi:MAG TPA: hypothetical protein VF805_03260 [Anaeromyxobacteraceae bacterium]
MTPPPRALLALAAALAACAAPRQPWREAAPPEVLLEILPRDAAVSLDGAPLAPGVRTVAVRDPEKRYRFSFRAAGFEPAEREEQGVKLAGARLGVALRPEGFGSERRLELDEGEGLARAAALLERRGTHQAALDYAERAIALTPEAPLPHLAAGDAARALGRRARAIQAYSAYLTLAPEAPDRAAVTARVEALRGDLTIPATGGGR